MNTKQQDSKEGQALGRASYYNHFIYTDGWTRQGRVMSNPLIRFNRNKDMIDNNIIIGHHIGITGRVDQRFSYKLLSTYSRNYGILNDRDIEPPVNRFDDDNKDEFLPLSQFRQDQFSFMIDVIYHVPQLESLAIDFGFATDIGEFTENKLGVMLGITWKNRTNGLFR